MGVEIERKFLVRHDGWRAAADAGTRMRQGYLCTDPSASVRVRLAGDCAWLNIKGALTPLRRLEYDYPIPVSEADEILQRLCGDRRLEKTRYRVPHAGRVWEVDVFEGDNAGLVLAEIELEHESDEFQRPDWLGGEVSHDPRYYNMNLATHPFARWRDEPASG